MGDVILSLPALAALRARFTESRITLMIGKPAERIVRSAAVSDDLIVVDRVAMRDGNKIRSIRDIATLIRDVRGRRFDLIIDLHSLPETNLLAFASGAGSRLLANRESRSIDRLGRFPVNPPAEDKSKHLTERYFDVLRPLGITEVRREFHLPPNPETAASVDARFDENGLRGKQPLGFAIGAGNPSRRWPLARFADVAERFVRTANLVPVIFLGPEETDLCEAVKDAFPPGAVVFDDLSLLEFAEACSRTAAFVTNDSGPAHIAGLAGVPVVIVMDERAPLTYLPLGRRVAYVNNSTLDRIDVASVTAAVESALVSTRT